jgi:hypothetical protein
MRESHFSAPIVGLGLLTPAELAEYEGLIARRTASQGRTLFAWWRRRQVDSELVQLLRSVDQRRR